jgi:hypothetical protein
MLEQDRARHLEGRRVVIAPRIKGSPWLPQPGLEEGASMVATNRRFFRLGAVAAIVGSLLAGVGNVLHPGTPVANGLGVARVISGSTIWTPVHLLIIAGLILMLGGLVAISQSIQGGLAGALARFGQAAAIAGMTVGMVLVMVDGVAAKQLADAWGVAPPEERAAALRVLLAEETVNFALAALFNILLAGVTYVLLGLAVAYGRAYPRWLGWVAVAGAVGSLAAGTLEALAGQSTAITKVSTIITPTVLTLWTAVIGVLLYRRAASLASASAAELDEVSPKALKPTNGAPPAPTLQASRRPR